MGYFHTVVRARMSGTLTPYKFRTCRFLNWRVGDWTVCTSVAFCGRYLRCTVHTTSVRHSVRHRCGGSILLTAVALFP